MEVKAVAKYVKVQPRKVRLVAREVRGKSAAQMAAVLRFHPSKGAFVLRKVLISAMANAEANHGMDARTLRIAEIRIDEGPKQKRIQARAMGRANRIFKRTSHITVVVAEGAEETPVTVAGTQPKARPSLAVSAKGKKKAKPDESAPAAPVAEEAAEDVVEKPTEAVEAEPVASESGAQEAGASEAGASDAGADAKAEAGDVAAESGEEKK